MTMTTSQGELWQKITQLYFQWDPDGNRLMPIKELNDKLPAVPPDMIRETLSHAKASRLAEFDGANGEGEFRPTSH